MILSTLVKILPVALALASCAAPADLVLTNARVYTLDWGEPDRGGRPAADAPHDADGWHPDAEAVAVRNGRISFVGTTAGARSSIGPHTRVIDLEGAVVLPGFVDSHTHVAELGRNLTRISLVGVDTEKEAVERVAAFAAGVPQGRWILGHGWDEGAWADRYPTRALLSARVPDHPVVLSGLHGFAVWGNDLALERAGITRASQAPRGGEILRAADGTPTGVLTNRATGLLTGAV
ncbi:MAG: amidohydrolase family protein, partial [Planctomycetota bacterium]